MKIIALLALSLCIQGIFLVTLEEVLPNLQVLEKYIKEYKTAKKSRVALDHLVLGYVRSEKYNSMAFDYACGSIPKDLVSFIANKDKEKGTKAQQCRKYGEIVLPSKEKMKFAHMFVTMNGIENKKSFTGGFSILTGWGGDTIQLANDIKNSNGDLNNLILEASKFVGKKGKFVESSLISDLDAPIIYKKKTSSNNFHDIIKSYYTGTEWKNRYKNFVKITFPGATKENLREVLYKKLIGDSWIKMFIGRRGLSGHKTHVRAAAYAFADYLAKRL